MHLLPFFSYFYVITVFLGLFHILSYQKAGSDYFANFPLVRLETNLQLQSRFPHEDSFVCFFAAKIFRLHRKFAAKNCIFAPQNIF